MTVCGLSLLRCFINMLLIHPFCFEAEIIFPFYIQGKWRRKVVKFIESTLPVLRPQNHSMVSYYCCNQHSVSASHSQISLSEYHGHKDFTDYMTIYCVHEQLPSNQECSDFHRLQSTLRTSYCQALQLQNKLQVSHSGKLNKLYFFSLPVLTEQCRLGKMKGLGNYLFIFAFFHQTEAEQIVWEIKRYYFSLKYLNFCRRLFEMLTHMEVCACWSDNISLFLPNCVPKCCCGYYKISLFPFL